jgi:hypothetical protein
MASMYHDYFYYDNDWIKKSQIIKKDPYRFVLTKKEEDRCYHRIKRFFFVFGLPSLYLYKSFRYHQELSRVRKLKFSSIQLLEYIPKTLLALVILYPLGRSIFIDWDKLKQHQIAKYELQKFDPNWFNYDDFKYVILNAPAYNQEDSVWGRITFKRLFYSYYQLPGWIRRRREDNPSIEQEVPPKYEYTPNGPREGENLKEMLNKPLPFLTNSHYN